MIKVLIADNNYLSRVGLELLVGELQGFKLLPTVSGNFKALQHQIKISKPDVLVVDYPSMGASTQAFLAWFRQTQKIKLIAITEPLSMPEYQALFKLNLKACLLKECGKEEILEAFNAVLQQSVFLCGKIIQLTAHDTEICIRNSYIKTLNCEGLRLTARELDIVAAIAEGLSNKQIAERLHLSPHTVATHRKNIFAKLNVGNTAEVVMFAVKNKLLNTQVELNW